MVVNENVRVVQFTPPGSDASIQIGKGITSAAPGSFQNTYLVVSDVDEARADLVRRGVEVSEVFHRGDLLLETLKSTAAAHGVHEKEIGKPDPDWPQWYAEEMTRRLSGAGYHLTHPSA